MQLEGQVAIITGAGSGLGAAVARALAAEGARCVLVGRRAAPLARVAEDIRAAGGTAQATAADVSDEGQVEDLVRATVRALGGVDLLVNGAGVFRPAPLEATSAALWDKTLGVNLRGAFLLCRAVWPHMRRRGGGQIVNLSSVAGVQGYADEAAYCASKFGLNGLTQALALEGRPHRIRVFAVCPGATATPLWEGHAPSEVIGRMLKPEQVAELVRWLVTAPDNLLLDPVIVRNFRDPWEGAA